MAFREIPTREDAKGGGFSLTTYVDASPFHIPFHSLPAFYNPTFSVKDVKDKVEYVRDKEFNKPTYNINRLFFNT
jgi:hypothetical protein